MTRFWKVRLWTLLSTCVITYLFTGELVTASALSLTLIGVNSIVMYALIR